MTKDTILVDSQGKVWLYKEKVGTANVLTDAATNTCYIYLTSDEIEKRFRQELDRLPREEITDQDDWE